MSSAQKQRREARAIKQFPRTSRINERYYARDNQPNWAQLTQSWHFEDARGRHYTIAARNSDTFQNLRLRYAPDPQPARCVADHRGAVTLWVRLPHDAPWFDQRHDAGMLLLRERRSGQRYLVRLDAHLKYSPTRRTGTVIMSGLGQTLCNLLLNEHAPPSKNGV